MKLCKDCKHFGRFGFTAYTSCSHPDAKRDPVSGRAFAEFERSIIGRCKSEGTLFEAKPVRVGFFRRLTARGN